MFTIFCILFRSRGTRGIRSLGVFLHPNGTKKIQVRIVVRAAGLGGPSVSVCVCVCVCVCPAVVTVGRCYSNFFSKCLRWKERQLMGRYKYRDMSGFFPGSDFLILYI